MYASSISFEAELARRFVDDRHHIEVVSHLQIRLLKQIIQDAFSIGVLLQLDDDAQAVAPALVPHFSNSFDFFLQTNVLHRGNESGLDDLIRNFRDDDLLLAAAQYLQSPSSSEYRCALCRFGTLHGFLLRP